MRDYNHRLICSESTRKYCGHCRKNKPVNIYTKVYVAMPLTLNRCSVKCLREGFINNMLSLTHSYFWEANEITIDVISKCYVLVDGKEVYEE